MEIRPASIENVPELMTLIHRTYRSEDSKKGWTHESEFIDGTRTTTEMLQFQIESQDSAILFYVNRDEYPDGRILGCVGVEKLLKNGEFKCFVTLLTVSPELQANGIGKKLLYATHDWAREMKCVALTMTVITIREELIAWYKRHGFEETGEQIPFYADPRCGIPKMPLVLNYYEKRL